MYFFATHLSTKLTTIISTLIFTKSLPIKIKTYWYSWQHEISTTNLSIHVQLGGHYYILPPLLSYNVCGVLCWTCVGYFTIVRHWLIFGLEIYAFKIFAFVLWNVVGNMLVGMTKYVKKIGNFLNDSQYLGLLQVTKLATTNIHKKGIFTIC